MARAGEGAGDQILALNCAFAWAKQHKTIVELEYHWVSDQDFKYVDSDPEFMGDRVDLMHSKMQEPELVHVEHVWGSVIFEQQTYEDVSAPRKWYFPNNRGLLHDKVPFSGHAGRAEWSFSEPPRETNKIVVWDYEQNREPPREYKTSLDFTWSEVIDVARKLFPEHEIVSLSYRDSFEKAYNEIRNCSFCLGYDGMWHLVARNFGKLFVTQTGDVRHTHENTYPNCSAFNVSGDHIIKYLSRLSDPEYLKVEQGIARRYHEKRMSWYE